MEGDTAKLSDAYFAVQALTSHVKATSSTQGSFTNMLLDDTTPESTLAVSHSFSQGFLQAWQPRADQACSSAAIAAALLDPRYKHKQDSISAAHLLAGQQFIVEQAKRLWGEGAGAKVQVGCGFQVGVSVYGWGCSVWQHTLGAVQNPAVLIIPHVCSRVNVAAASAPLITPMQAQLMKYKVQPSSIGATEEAIKATNMGVLPEQFWKALEPQAPELSKLARMLLVIPPASASSERLFSAVGRVWDCSRSRLTNNRVRKLLFVYFNRKALLRDGQARDADDFAAFQEWMESIPEEQAIVIE